MASLLVLASLAITGAVWQGRQSSSDVGAIAGTTASPQAGARQAEGSTISDLRSQVRALAERVRLLEAGRQVRALSQERAEQFTAYLKAFGRRRVVVSCPPDDLEAYQYANQLANVLRAADWDARGPELTKMFGDVRAPGINVYVNSADTSDTAKILLDGFANFNIPYQSRVTPSQAIPDNTAVELFVGTKQPDKATAGGD